MILALGGFFIFISASLGKLDQSPSIFGRLAIKQGIVLLVGLGLFFVLSRINYKKIRPFALPILVSSFILTLLVWIPQLGSEAGGARRWLVFGSISLQPSEFLKLGLVIYFAAWLATVKNKVSTTKWGFIPLMVLLGVAASALVVQPDIGTLLVISASLVGMYFVSGANWKHLSILGLIGIIALGAIIYTKPHVRERINTFIDRTSETQSRSYQINRSLIAVGSGGVVGRGFGQSIQKFSFLPEPIGDSIFAVASEEFGFIGSVIIVMTFFIYGLIGFKISARAPDNFGKLLVIGIVILILCQSFMNIAAMLGLIPLTGKPLIFISQGGSALLFALIGSGIIASVARSK